MKRTILAATATMLLMWAPQARATVHSGRQSVAGFYSNDDGDDHAIVLLSNGDIREIFYVDGSFHSGSVLINIPDAVAIAGFYTDYDQNRHVIVGRSNGVVEEVYYGWWGLSTTPLGSSFGSNTIKAVAG